MPQRRHSIIYFKEDFASNIFASELAVSAHWLAWYQSADTVTWSNWAICAYNLRTGAERVVETARAEGQAPGHPVRMGNGELALGGDVLAWTTEQDTRRGVRSLLKVANLTTGRVSLVAAAQIAPSRQATVLGWPTTDGRFLAWDRTVIRAPGKAADTVVLYDLLTHRTLAVPEHGLASEPAVGYGQLAWKRGARFARSAGIGVFSLTTRHTLIFNAVGAARPSLGSCLVAYQFFDASSSHPPSDGMYDFCTGQALNLTSQQLLWPSGMFFFGIQVAGHAALMNANFSDRVAPHTAIFLLSAAHPLYDWYH